MNYMAITTCEVTNGNGCRVALWVAGCPHHCPGCHNPETWDIHAGKEFDGKAFSELLNELKPDYIEGLAFSGGDPLHPDNRETVGKIAQMVHTIYPNKNIWLWTGYNLDEVRSLWFMEYIDVIVDGAFIEAQKDITLAFRGSRNQTIWVKNNGNWVKSDLN